jgi:hypothetical protein
LGSAETNDTDSEITAYVRADADTDGALVVLNANINGSNVDKFAMKIDSGSSATVQLPAIPPGASYEVNEFGDTANFSLEIWREFRP